MTQGVDDHVLYVKTKGDTVIVGSEPVMPSQHHDTIFDLKDPNQCRMFLRAIASNPNLMERVGLENQHSVVAKAIENLGKSFGESVPALIKTDLVTINNVGQTYSEYKVVGKAVLAANQSADNKGVDTTNLKPILIGQRRDQAIAKAME